MSPHFVISLTRFEKSIEKMIIPLFVVVIAVAVVRFPCLILGLNLPEHIRNRRSFIERVHLKADLNYINSTTLTAIPTRGSVILFKSNNTLQILKVYTNLGILGTLSFSNPD